MNKEQRQDKEKQARGASAFYGNCISFKTLSMLIIRKYADSTSLK
jgi:hypothetical protein